MSGDDGIIRLSQSSTLCFGYCWPSLSTKMKFYQSVSLVANIFATDESKFEDGGTVRDRYSTPLLDAGAVRFLFLSINLDQEHGSFQCL